MADTSVGSIKGNLELDIADWMEGIAQAKTAEEGLHDGDDIKLDADVDQALAKIESVRAAAAGLSTENLSGPSTGGDASEAIANSKAVAAATRDLDLANQRVATSYQKVDEAQSRAGEGSASYMTASTGLTKSLNQQHDAFDNLSAAIDAEKNKIAGSKDATDDDAKAKEKNADSTDKATNSNHGLLGALLPLAPALIPIAAGAVGVGAAIGGMAGSAVIAVMGVKEQMAQGTAVGQEYSAGLTTLKSDFSTLKGVASAGLLEGFTSSVSSLNASMPTTSRLVALLAQDTGKITSDGVSGFLGILRQMQPVIQQVDNWVVKGAQGFAQWGQGSGAQSFVSYLLTRLPAVENTLGSLVGTVGKVVQAFAPWGDIVLSAVTMVSQAINMIPAPVLFTIATGAMAAYVAFKGWGAITSIISGVKKALESMSAATSLSTGTIGLIIGGIGLLAAAYAAFSSQGNDAAKSQTDFTQALQQSNGAIDQSVRAAAAKQLQDSGAIDKAKQLKISTSELVDAALGEGDAYESVTNSLQKTADAHQKTTAAGQYGMSTWDSEGNAARDLTSALTGTHDGLANAKKAQDELNASTQGTMSSTTGMQTILGMSSQKWNEVSAAENDATTAANNYKTALDILNGGAQALEASQIKLSQDFTSGAETIKSNISQVGSAQATSMDINTKYGAANQSTIHNMIIDSQSLADSIIKNEGDSKKAREDANQSLTESKQKILDFAKANGLSADAVQDMINKEMQYNALDVPAKDVNVNDLASSILEKIKLKATSLPGGKVTITGDNKQAMDAIAKVTGAKVDKHGNLTLNSQQYDVALALANGAKIDPKTEFIYGNNSDAFKKLAEANGWKLVPKTDQIIGDNGPFMSSASQVEKLKINGKSVTVSAETAQAIANVGAVIQSINDVHGKTVTLQVVTQQGNVHVSGATGYGTLVKAAGGPIIGPGTGTSDSVPLWGSNGEHMFTAEDVKAMGGQKAVLAFRSSLHAGKGSKDMGSGFSKTDAPQMASTQMAYPPTITLVDANGSLLGRMKVVAEQSMSNHNANLRRGLING